MFNVVVATASLLTAYSASPARYAGGDISLLPEYEKAGAVYKDIDGQPVADLLPWLRTQGLNAMRVRLFVNPGKYRELHADDTDPDTRYDPNACQDLDYILPLCKRIVDNGFDLMLDFHYSDTWADPSKQWTPVDWEGLDDSQLCQKVYDYTRDVLTTLKNEGIVPAFIQPGNEISYGMLWGPSGTSTPKKTLMGSDDNWQRLGDLLGNAIDACREICPDAKIVIHTERTGNTDVEKNFYDHMEDLDVDYDIIGLSYYPYFHGDIHVLDRSLSAFQSAYPEKDIMIVETGYSYAWEVPGTIHDLSHKWTYSVAGQDSFAKDLVTTLEKYDHADGLFWWWMEYNAFSTGLSGWYNAPLFDSRDGRATPALKTICSYADDGAGITDITDRTTDSDHTYYDLLGRPSRGDRNGIYIHRGKKIVINSNN